MARKRKRRTRYDLSAALRRQIAADGWVPRYRKAMSRVLDSQLRDVLSSVRRGVPPSVWQKQYRARWERDLRNAKRDMVLEMAASGYMLGIEEFDRQMTKAQAKTLMMLLEAKAEAVSIAIATEELKTTRLRADVEKYINETSKIETATSAARFGNYHKTAIAADMTIRDTAKLVRSKGLALNDMRADLMAHTTTQWAYNNGAMEAYKDEGVAAMEWLTAFGFRTCPICIAADGEQRPIGETFSTGTEHPPAHPLCLVGETPILAPDKWAAFVAPYYGPIIEIGLSCGSRLSVTANHMFLTPWGFARAQSLRKGDQVFYSPTFQRIVAGNPNNHRGPTSIQDAVEALAKAPGMSAPSVPVAAEYLHGDGRFVDGDINIIAPDSFLKGNTKAPTAKDVAEFNFSRADIDLIGFIGCRNLTSTLFALARATVGSVGVRGEAAAFSSRKTLHAQLASFPAITRSNVGRKQKAADNAATYIETNGKSKFGFASDVAITYVTFIRVRDFHGHVFDLHTLSSLYVADGLLSSNCRCAVTAVILPEQVWTAEQEAERLKERGVKAES